MATRRTTTNSYSLRRIVPVLPVAIVLLIAANLIVHACDPTAQEMAVRMKIQQLITMFPSIYDDIRSGRLVPNRPNYQQGINTLPNGQYIQPGQQYVQPGQYIQPGQQIVQPGQQIVQPGQQIVQPVG